MRIPMILAVCVVSLLASAACAEEVRYRLTDALRLDGAVAINRHDFGMTYGKGKIDDTVEVRFNVDTRR